MYRQRIDSGRQRGQSVLETLSPVGPLFLRSVESARDHTLADEAERVALVGMFVGMPVGTDHTGEGH